MLVNEGTENQEGLDENQEPIVKAEEAKEIVTEKKFSDLTNDDIAGMTEEDATAYAKRQGWKSPDKFNGDMKKVKSAKEYLHDSFNEMPIMSKNLKRQADELESLKELLSNTTKQFTDMNAKQQDRHKKDLEKALANSEAKLKEAKEDFDIEKVEAEKENVIEFKNEIKSIDDEAVNAVNFEKEQAQRKAEEFQRWAVSLEAQELQKIDYAKYLGFERLVAEIYKQNINAPVKDIIAKAKEKAYGVKKPAHVEGTKPGTKSKEVVNISEEDKGTIKRYLDIEVSAQRKKGMSEKDITEFRKTRQKAYENLYKEN